MPTKDNNPNVDFIGLGAPKCATTWIYKCLDEHPEICTSSEKETGFFSHDEQYEQGLKRYSKYFSNCSGEKIKGEFSVFYLHKPKVPARIHSEFPNAKLIASLRNPIERAYSHYEFAKNIKTKFSGYDSLEETLTDKEFIRMGLYGRNLERYLQFFPKENIKIILYEDIKKSPKETIEDIYNFLDVAIDFTPPFINKRVNATGTKTITLKINFLTQILHKIRNNLKKREKLFSLLKSSPLHILHRKLIAWNRNDLNKINQQKTSSIEDMDPKVRSKLREIYKDDISKLEKLTDQSFNQWKSST